MPYVVLDTETSGLFDFKLPADAPGQPRLAEVHLILLDDDLKIEEQRHFFVKPEGWEMTEGATKVNGLTTEMLTEKGVPVVEVLAAYTDLIKAGRIAVAHNSQYDLKMMRAELRRAGKPDLFEETPNICTMRGLTDVCKIPPKGGRGGYKFPALSEACVFFGITNMGDHSAQNDALAVVELLRQMKSLNVLPDAKVHHSKNHEAIVAAGEALKKPVNE